MNRGMRGADFMLRHRNVADSKKVEFVTIAIDGTGDPGPFRSPDQRTLVPGEAGTHVIVAAVFAHLTLRWVITAGSRNPKVEYQHDPTGNWGSHTHSDIFGDDFISEYDADQHPNLSQPPAASPSTLLNTFTGEARFSIRHCNVSTPCITLPHEVESKALVGGYHEKVGIGEAMLEDKKETSKTRCL